MNQRAMDGIGNDLVNALARALGRHFRSGDLLNSISYKINGNKIEVSMLPSWKYLEWGTVPHVIEAKPGKVLHWKSDGKDFFAKRVHHPGTPPSPFVRPVIYNELKGIVQDNVRRHASGSA